MDHAKELRKDELGSESDHGHANDGMGGPANRRRNMLLAGVGAVIVVVAAVALTRDGEHHPAAAEPTLRAESGALVASAQAAELRYVDVAVAQRKAPLPPLPAPARVQVAESRSTPVVAPLAGRVEQVVVQLGDEVKPGQNLVAIRSSSLPELGRDIETTRAALAVKRASAERMRDLVRLRAVPEKDLLLAEEEQREAEIAMHTAEGKRRSLRLGNIDAGGLYWLTAPRAGTIVDRHALVGMEVGPDRSDPLLSVAELDEVVVVADLLESDVAGVKPGQKVDVTPANSEGPGLEGVVEYVSAVVDPTRRTVGVRARVPNPDHRLRPNAFAHVSFKEAVGGPVIVVPTESVVTDGQRSVVFVRKDEGAGKFRFIRRAVRPGRSREGSTEILEGLEPGETFVARGALLLLNALDLEG